MEISDDRTQEQRETHYLAVVGRDSFLSGWGNASNGYSRAAWACAPNVDVNTVERHIRNRSDMKYVNVIDLRTYRPPRGTVHFHIYVCDKNHRYAQR